ncbi:MAG: hypothetical protein HP034_05920 [Bacteroides sp.]|nr:hypothetical protein [Bacteroides sp.]
MSYSLIYTVPFAALDNIPCVVEIEKDGYEGTPTELTAGATPFTVDIEGEEFLYTPTRFSTAKLQVVGSDYLQSLFSTAYKEFRVTLKKNGVITWCGFIKPELYTQDYTAKTFTLEIECISAMSVLEFIDYTIKEKNRGFVSLWYLLQLCIKESNGRYDAVYIPHIYASSKAAYSTEENVLADMVLSEQDFFDEDDKPMKLKEVLEEVCKFLNWTCADWKGDLYFVDVDHTGDYHEYNITLEEKADSDINELCVQDIGFAGANHSLDILPGYNKVTVKCSNYPVGEVFPEEDYSNLVRLGDRFAHAREYVEDNKISRKVYFLPDAYQMFHYEPGTAQNPVSETEIKKMSLDDIEKLYGAMPVKKCNYEMKKNGDKWEPNITNYNYEDLIQIRTVLYPSGASVNDTQYNLKSENPILTFKDPLPTALYRWGAFAIQGSVQLVMASENRLPTLIPRDEMYSFGEDLARFAVPPYFVCEFSIGNKYWNGSSFVEGYSTFNVYIDDGKDGTFHEPVSGGFLSIKSTKTLSMPYDGLDGYIIPLGNAIGGQPKFVIKNFVGVMFTGYINCFLKDLKCVFQKMDGEAENNDSDRIYENVLNENYINELDEIEFKISSYNNDGACYSKVMLGNDYLKDNLYNSILDDTIRPEEMMITRCINHYSATRIKLTQEIKERADLSPITRLSDTFLVGKKFINAGGSIDYKMNRFECIMIEV